MPSVKAHTTLAPTTAILTPDGEEVRTPGRVSPARREEVRSFVSPGEPHTHAVEVGGERFVVRRPTRGMLRTIRRRIAAECSVFGPGSASVVALHDGRLLEGEAYLVTCLVEAPASWLRDGAVYLDDLDERDIGAVWDAVRPWLAQFEYGAAPPPPPAGASDAGAVGE